MTDTNMYTHAHTHSLAFATHSCFIRKEAGKGKKRMQVFRGVGEESFQTREWKDLPQGKAKKQKGTHTHTYTRAHTQASKCNSKEVVAEMPVEVKQRYY